MLLAANEDGYGNLMRLTSRAFLDTPSGEPAHVKLAMLGGLHQGLIALTAGPGGPLDLAVAAGQTELAAARCAGLAAIFGDRLYVELQRHGLPEGRQVEATLLDLAYTNNLPLVAANEPFYARREEKDVLRWYAGKTAKDVAARIEEAKRKAAHGLLHTDS